jgi:hypothetical protein
MSTSEVSDSQQLTVGNRVRGLRELLKRYPTRDHCHSFAGRGPYTLARDFFPAHWGLLDLTRESVSTLVLGSDWGTLQSYEEWLLREKPRHNSTVSGANRLLEKAGFDRLDCFYTNAWPLMRDRGKEQGSHQMRDDLELTNAYREYLRHTLRELDIKLVISLGYAPAWFVGPLCGPNWRLGQLASWKHVTRALFDSDPLGELSSGIIFVNATHTSHWAANASKRCLPAYGDEIGLLIEARRRAQIPDAPGWIKREASNNSNTRSGAS